MNSPNQEQLEAHMRDFEIYWQAIVLPVLLDGAWLDLDAIKSGAWESWLADDSMTRMGIE